MDLSQYAELFLAESREHLSACNHLLLEWERSPANPAPVAGREEHIDVAEVTADLDRALVALAPPGEPRAAAAVPAVEPGAPAAGGAPSAAPGHLVEVTLRAEAPLKGARAALLLQRAQGLGAVHGIVPPAASF